MNSSLPYRPCVGLVIINKHGQVFAGERIDTPGAWQMPQGGVDEGEDLSEAARREMREEIGCDCATILRINPEPIRYDLPADLQATLWGGKYAGQEQRWIALQFNGEDNDIILDGDDHPEFSKWQWMDFDNLLDYIVPFKHDVYIQVQSAFSDLLA